MIRVAVADDHTVVREGLKRLLEEEPDMALVAEAEDGNGLVERCREANAHVLLMDVSMPGPGFLELLKEIREELPALAVVVFSVHSEDLFAVRAFRAGAAGYLTKEHSPEELTLAIRRVREGGRYVAPSLAEKLVFDLDATAEQAPGERLSDREFQVLRGLASGSSLKRIAHELGVSPKTVSTYRSRALRKLGLENDAQLVRYALEHGVIK